MLLSLIATRLNVIWIVFFLVFEFTTTACYLWNKQRDEPYTLSEYKERSGSTVDYYIGYLVFTTVDVINYHENDKYKLDIAGKTVFRYAYLGFLAFIWFFGLERMYRIRSYLSKVKEYKIPSAVVRDELKKPHLLTYVLASLAMLMTLYMMYYTVVYLTYFKMQ